MMDHVTYIKLRHGARRVRAGMETLVDEAVQQGKPKRTVAPASRAVYLTRVSTAATEGEMEALLDDLLLADSVTYDFVLQAAGLDDGDI